MDLYFILNYLYAQGDGESENFYTIHWRNGKVFVTL